MKPLLTQKKQISWYYFLLPFILFVILYGIHSTLSFEKLTTFPFSHAETCTARFSVSVAKYSFSKSCLIPGQSIYSDNDLFTYFRFPGGLANLAYVRTGNLAEKADPNLSWDMSFQSLSQVYIFYRKIPGQSVPAWITTNYDKVTPDDFSNLNVFVLRKNNLGLIGVYDVWKKKTVSPAQSSVHFSEVASANAFSMYIVAVQDLTSVGSASPVPSGTSQPTSPPIGSCSVTVPANISVASGKGNFSSVKPGDTVCIPSGNRSVLTLVDFVGTNSAPITFVNSGGKVSFNGGLRIYGSQHIRFTGAGVPSLPYGFEVSGNALETNHIGTDGILDGSEYLEVDHVEIHDTSQAIRMAKNDNLLDTGTVWTGHQFYVHDNYIHDTTGEAMYIGTSDTHGLFPIHDVQVWNNKIINTGFDGIQVRQGHTKVLVHDNYIDGTGSDPRKNGTIDSTAGFNIAKGSDTGDWYNNTIKNARIAVHVQDSTNIRIYNNLIVDSGHATAYSPVEGAVEFIANARNNKFFNNTVVNNRLAGKYAVQFKSSTGNQIFDNIIVGNFQTLFLAPTGNSTSNNITGAVDSAGFVNVASGNYHLQSTSQGVDSASNSIFPTFDFEYNSRPFGAKSDIGAFEYHN